MRILHMQKRLGKKLVKIEAVKIKFILTTKEWQQVSEMRDWPHKRRKRSWFGAVAILGGQKFFSSTKCYL